jgi:hypothetical protein
VAAKLLAPESQLGIRRLRIDRKGPPKPTFTVSFRLLWVVLSRFRGPWRGAARVMQPATVSGWHTRAFKLCRRWKCRKKPGGHRISQKGHMENTAAPVRGVMSHG